MNTYSRLSRLSALLVSITISMFSTPAAAVNVSYDFDGTCQPGYDCGPLGVLDSAVTTVTGTLELDLQEPTVEQFWDKDNVLSYSFVFENFTIDNTNSTLSNSVVGNIPFTTSASAPFKIDDGFLIATYDLDNSVFLNIALGGVNLVQGSLSGCNFGSCQALALGDWTRTSIPVPPAVYLFGSGLLGLVGIARKKAAFSS